MFDLSDRFVAKKNLHALNKPVFVAIGHKVDEVEQHEDNTN
jgi:hypothetical protein